MEETRMISLLVPERLLERVAAAAKQSERSLNGEIRRALRQAYCGESAPVPTPATNGASR